ncbi:MAG: MFS transporter [Candidatus Binatia bacterium]|jgi:MFS family permease
MTVKKSDSIWTPTFTLLCSAQFLGYAQHAVLTPVLPLYVTYLGGSAFMVGLVLAAFAATSVVVRPVVGHWTDRWNEAGVMISGLLFQGVSIFICFLPFVGAAMLANALRGIGWAGLNTGGYSLLALTAPESRRGEASGLYSGVQSASAILFPALALWLLQVSFGGFGGVFVISAIFSFAGAALGAIMARNVPHAAPRNIAPETTRQWWYEIFHFVERDILLPSIILFWLNISLPSITNFSVLYARDLGVMNFGTFFIVLGVTSLLGRPLLGRLSDKFGRDRSIAAGFVLQLAALLLITTVANLFGMIIAGALYMMGNALGSSTTLALAVERADPRRRGKAMATFSVAYPLSYGVGSLITGSAVEVAGYTGMFLVLAAVQALGLVFALLNGANLRSQAM